MDKVVETNVGLRKEWVSPELKKIDIEQITESVFGGFNSDDSFHS